jgi:hypothetical protein
VTEARDVEWRLTDVELAEWRTGLHAANPQQAQALVALIDRMAAAVGPLLKPLLGPKITIDVTGDTVE